MFLEGFFFKKSEEYSKQEVSARYEEAAFLKNGYIGFSGKDKLANYIYSISACVINVLGEKTFLGNDTQNVFSPFFLSPSGKVSNYAFGVAITFDEQKQTLYLAREVFGRCPLYYIAIPNELIAFSTSLQSLLADCRVRKHISIDHSRVASYATFSRDVGAIYSEQTFYNNVKSVLPGHTLELNITGSQKSNAYATFSPSRWSHLTSIEEFGEEFRNLFAKSVNRCLPDKSLSVSSHLSGGLDSTSVSGMFRHLFPERPLYTLYNMSNTADTDENLFVREIAWEIKSNHHEILQSADDFGLMSTYIHLTGLPSSSLLSPSFTGSLMHYAKDLGCGIVLNGVDGDSIAGSGLEMIIRSLQVRDWKLVEDLLRKRVKYYTHANKYVNWDRLREDQKYHLVLQNFLYARLSSKFLSSSLQEFHAFYCEIAKHFPVSYGYFARRGLGSVLNKFRKKQFKPSTHILREEVVRELSDSKADQDELLRGLLETDASEDIRQSFKDVYTSQAILANEQNYVLSKHYQIANGSPFYDKDLFELCMAVPDLMKFGDGIGRSHFRQAMKGITPESVRTRSTKTHIRSHGQDVIKRMYQQASPMLADAKELWYYIDRKSFEQQVGLLYNDKVPHTHKVNTWFLISRTISLAIWLDQNKA